MREVFLKQIEDDLIPGNTAHNNEIVKKTLRVLSDTQGMLTPPNDEALCNTVARVLIDIGILIQDTLGYKESN